jgi:hypothetical protein
VQREYLRHPKGSNQFFLSQSCVHDASDIFYAVHMVPRFQHGAYVVTVPKSDLSGESADAGDFNSTQKAETGAANR